MQATIVYTTARAEPRLDWLVEDLEAQALPTDELQLIVVDALGRAAEGIGFRPTACVVDLVETRPKPCPWQGPQRITSVDWWAMSNARNTGIALCSSDYVAFLDDRCHLGPRWLAALRRGQETRESVLAGPYDKTEPDGRGGTRVVTDHRIQSNPDGLVDCGGSWLYGCCMAMPLSWLLEVNGFEEGADSLSAEDYLLGLMLGNHHRRIDLVADLMVHQDRPPEARHGFCRTDKGVSPHDKSHAALHRFSGRRRTEFTPDLTALRAELAAGGRFPDVDPDAPHLDWYDGQPIREMVPPP